MRRAAVGPMDRAAAAGRVALQYCLGCGAGQYPPREACRACLSDGLGWRMADAVEGALVAVAVVAHSHDPVFAKRLPLRVGLVRVSDMTLVCFVPEAEVGPVRVRAALDGAGRAIFSAAAPWCGR